MQTEYKNVLDDSIEGAPYGTRRNSRSMTLPWQAQSTQIRIGALETGNLVINVVDDETQQSYSITVALSTTTAATSLDEMVTAAQANVDFNNLFTFSEDASQDFQMDARHANRTYTVTTTPPGSMTAVVSSLQAAGGSGLEFGRLVARGSGDDEFEALTATSTLANIVGGLFRTDGNHLHSLENDTPSAVDASDRGRTYSVMYDGGMTVKVEDAVTPASKVYVRRAQTGSVGAVGRVRATPAGTAQVVTATPTAANDTNYALQIHFTSGPAKGETHVIQALGDGSATATEICNDLRTSLNSNARLAALITESGTATLILTASAVDTEFEVEDVGAGDFASITETTARDDDTIDISSIAEFESTAAADGLARLRINL
jgi:hypothetical protein